MNNVIYVMVHSATESFYMAGNADEGYLPYQSLKAARRVVGEDAPLVWYKRVVNQ